MIVFEGAYIKINEDNDQDSSIGTHVNIVKLETKFQAVENNGVIPHLAWPLLVHAPSEASFQRPVVAAAVVANVDVVDVQLDPEKN